MKKISVLLLIAILSCCIPAPFAVGAEGGDGSSIEKAIIIKYTGDYFESIGQEYKYIEKKFGVSGKNWEMLGQIQRSENNRFYDVIGIKLLPSGEETAVYFDITDLITNSPFK